MSLLPVILIAAGYVALVVTAGPIGVVLAVLHIAIMVGAVGLGGRPRRGPPQ